MTRDALVTGAIFFGSVALGAAFIVSSDRRDAVGSRQLTEADLLVFAPCYGTAFAMREHLAALGAQGCSVDPDFQSAFDARFQQLRRRCALYDDGDNPDRAVILAVPADAVARRDTETAADAEAYRNAAWAEVVAGHQNVFPTEAA